MHNQYLVRSSEHERLRLSTNIWPFPTAAVGSVLFFLHHHTRMLPVVGFLASPAESVDNQGGCSDKLACPALTEFSRSFSRRHRRRRCLSQVEVTHKFATPKTLVQQYLFIPAKHKDCYLSYILNEFAGQTTIVFVSTCNNAQVCSGARYFSFRK